MVGSTLHTQKRGEGTISTLHTQKRGEGTISTLHIQEREVGRISTLPALLRDPYEDQHTAHTGGGISKHCTHRRRGKDQYTALTGELGRIDILHRQ